MKKITVRCPRCKDRYTFLEEDNGKYFQCPTCNYVFQIMAPPASRSGWWILFLSTLFSAPIIFPPIILLTVLLYLQFKYRSLLFWYLWSLESVGFFAFLSVLIYMTRDTKEQIIVIFTSIIAFVITLLTFLFSYLNYKQKKDNTEQDEEQNTDIKREEQPQSNIRIIRSSNTIETNTPRRYNPIYLLLSWDGRIDRRQWWMAFLYCLLFWSAETLVICLFMNSDNRTALLIFLWILFSIERFIFRTAMDVKRFNDIGKNRILVVIFVHIYWFAAFVSSLLIPGARELFAILSIPVGLYTVIYLIELALAPGCDKNEISEEKKEKN